MSVYYINKVAREIVHNLKFRELAKKDPEKALSSFPLSEEQKKLILKGDVASLYQLGANPFLLQHFARFNVFGLDQILYNKRMRALAKH